MIETDRATEPQAPDAAPSEPDPSIVDLVGGWVQAVAQLVTGAYVILGILLVALPTRLRFLLEQWRLARLERELSDVDFSFDSFQTQVALQEARRAPLAHLERRARTIVDAWLDEDPGQGRQLERWQQAAFARLERIAALDGEHELDIAAERVAQVAGTPEGHDAAEETTGRLADARAGEVETAIRVLVSAERQLAAIDKEHDTIRPESTDTGQRLGNLRVERDRSRVHAAELHADLPKGLWPRFVSLLRPGAAAGASVIVALAVLGISFDGWARDVALIVLTLVLGAGGVVGANRARQRDRSATWITVVGGELLILACLALLLGEALGPRVRIGPTEILDKAYLVVALLTFVVVGVVFARGVFDSLLPGWAGAALGVVAAIAVLVPGVQIGVASADYVASGVVCTDAEPAPPRPRTFASTPPPADPTAVPQRAIVDTSCGEFTMDFSGRPGVSASAVNAFAYLARAGFYDGMRWDFVSEGLVAAGDPTGGHGSLPGFGYPVPDPVTAAFPAGVVGMTVDGGQQGSSRFFIAGPDGFTFPWGAHAVVGTVTQGLGVIDGLGSHANAKGDGGSDRPLYIFSVRVE